MRFFRILVMLFIVGTTIGFLSCDNGLIPTKGNGNIINSERTVSSFKKIHSSGSAEVRFNASQEYKVVVTTDSNLIENVTTDIRNDLLYIGTKRGNYSFTKLLINIYCPVITYVSISGSGTFYASEKISVSDFESDISGSGKINMTIECNKFFTKIAGSGALTVSGSSKDSNMNISGSGDIDGNDFHINNATVNISGSGKATINVTNNLKATISGSGVLNYRGNPAIIESDVSGSGKINKL